MKTAPEQDTGTDWKCLFLRQVMLNGNFVRFLLSFCFSTREFSGISGLVGTQWCKWRVLETRVMVSGGRCEGTRECLAQSALFHQCIKAVTNNTVGKTFFGGRCESERTQ